MDGRTQADRGNRSVSCQDTEQSTPERPRRNEPARAWTCGGHSKPGGGGGSRGEGAEKVEGEVGENTEEISHRAHRERESLIRRWAARSAAYRLADFAFWPSLCPLWALREIVSVSSAPSAFRTPLAPSISSPRLPAQEHDQQRLLRV